MDWSVSTSGKNYVMFKFPICFPCVLGKVNFFNQLNVYRKMVQKFHYHRWIPFKIKENTQIQISVQFFLKSPGICLSVICPYTWKYLNSRITGVSTLCSFLLFQSYFSGPILVHFTHKCFFKVGRTHSFHIKFSVSKNRFGIMQDMPCFWRMSQQKCFFQRALKHVHYNNAAALETLVPFWHWKSSLFHLCHCWALISCDFPFTSVWGGWKQN